MPSAAVSDSPPTRVVACAVGVHRYFDAPEGQLRILRGIDLDVPEATMIAITGASGVGKSTLLHILGGLDAPTSGDVYWDGQSPYHMNEESRAHYRNKSVGFVFQFHYLLPEFTAEENVALPLIIGGTRLEDALIAARSLLSDLGLGNRGAHRPGELSGGEQQRTALARALVTGARLIVADEPSGNLDSRTAEQLHELLGTKLMDRGCSVVLATHNPDLARRAGIRYVLSDGVLRKAQPPI
ncbi:MAG TPA: ABC transporter ATP-binding protein [candidate division Zixibacteria bacterium]|jgi:lipoprotein-releasing system ATP-binding protein